MAISGAARFTAHGSDGPGGGGDGFADGDANLDITGGTVTVDSGGDGIDVNGTVTMSAGTVIVDGPSEQMNGALDHDGGWDQTGGTLVATGSSGMISAPDTASAQLSLVSTFSTAAAGTTIEVISADGEEIVTVTPTKAFASIVLSTWDVSAEASYQVALDGTVVDETTTADAATSGMGPGGGMGGGPGRPSRP